MGSFHGPPRIADRNETKDGCEGRVASDGRNHSVISRTFETRKRGRIAKEVFAGYGLLGHGRQLGYENMALLLPYSGSNSVRKGAQNFSLSKSRAIRGREVRTEN